MLPILDFALNEPPKEIGDAYGEVHRDDAELMQFTRLYDVKGKQIYEGDGVNFDGARMTVRWSEADAGFYLHQEPWNEWHQIKPTCEIIGNIYENPELLSKAA